jgi:hypothetical protein
MKSQVETVLVGKKNVGGRRPYEQFYSPGQQPPLIKFSSLNVKSPSDGKRLLKFEFVVPYTGGIIVGWDHHRRNALIESYTH